jgi:hypothetical protein
MNCIDTFSKYAWSIPLKDKSEATVIQGFKKMLAKMKENAGVLPSTILSDNGSEFINSGMQKVFKDNNIRHILTNAGKASHAKSVERFNLYTRHAVTRYKTQFDDTDWTSYIQLLVDNYNKTQSRVTKKAPIDIVKQGSDPKNPENLQTKENIKRAVLPKNDTSEIVPYKVGDHVRVKVMLANDFEHPSNNISWSRELYTVAKVKMPKGESALQPSYRIADKEGKEVKEDYYHNDLRKVNENILVNVDQPELFVVQKIIDDKSVDKRRFLLVKFKDEKQAIWQPFEVIRNDVPKMVKQYLDKKKGEKEKKQSPSNPPSDDAPPPPPKPKGRQTNNSNQGRRIQPSRQAKQK